MMARDSNAIQEDIVFCESEIDRYRKRLKPHKEKLKEFENLRQSCISINHDTSGADALIDGLAPDIQATETLLNVLETRLEKLRIEADPNYLAAKAERKRKKAEHRAADERSGLKAEPKAAYAGVGETGIIQQPKAAKHHGTGILVAVALFAIVIGVLAIIW